MADDNADASQEAGTDSQDNKPEPQKDTEPQHSGDGGSAAKDGKPERKQEGEPEGKGLSKSAHKDDEQERKDWFAEAAGDPLADALGGSSAQAGAGQARRSWMRVHASGASAFVGGGNIGVLNINTASGGHTRLAQAPGQLRDEVVTELINRYVPVPDYEALVKELSSSRLLVLRGAPGTGRTTTGLRLLAKLAGNVARFSPDTDLRALTEASFEPSSGYLMELNPGSGFVPPAPADIDRVREHLAKRECYLILVAPHDIRYRDAFAGSFADCPLPDPREVYEQAVEYEIRGRADEGETLRKIAAQAQPRIRAGPQTPAEVQWLVAHLMSSATTNYSEADLDILYDHLAARYASAWFEPLAALPPTSEGDEPVRLAAFRIALAVLNDTPLDLVVEASENLARSILQARSLRRTISRPVFTHHREDYAANSRASVRQGTVRFLSGTVPAHLVSFDDDRLPQAVLRHVWAMHNLRGPLLSWLESLSEDGRPFVYWPAALTIGLLTSWDFSYTFHEWIEPWAGSEKPRRSWTAAAALSEASRNAEVRPGVREILEEWSKHGTSQQRWTCAIALGSDPGLQDPAKALTELRKLGCWKDGQLADAASWAIARIFLSSGIKPVIHTLNDWLDDDRQAVRLLALVTVLRIADIKVSELEDKLELTAAGAADYSTRLAGRRRWPLLVALADDDPALLDPLADLVWQLGRSAWAEKATADTLKRWIRAGTKDPACVGPVGRFMALLGDDHTDRARLLHLVGLLRHDRDEPLPAPIADRLERAIESNIHIADEKRQSDVQP